MGCYKFSHFMYGRCGIKLTYNEGREVKCNKIMWDRAIVVRFRLAL